MTIELMDTTLRDGEQTTGVSFNESEKLAMAAILLEELKVDRIEVASARVSDGEYRAVQKITEWASKKGLLNKVEVLGFVDGSTSLEWIQSAGGQVLNLLTKGSLKHLSGQLRKTPEEHVDDIKKVLSAARKMNIDVNIYLEDWSNGMINSPDYVFYLLDELQNTNIKRFMLPDTLGVLNPDQVTAFCSSTIAKYPDMHIDFHAHNDYDLAVANVFAAVRAGVKGIHTTINGLGERAGNAPLASVAGILSDQLGAKCNLKESKLTQTGEMVESFSGIRIPSNTPLTGEFVFTQCSGVHADGDNKDNLYFNPLMPERFGRVRKYALGKTSGKANILKNLEELGIDLSPDEMKTVTKRVIELGDKKEMVTTEDLPYIISDVLKSKSIKEHIKMVNYSLSLTRGMQPTAGVSIQINGETYQETSNGDGMYDGFMKALWKIYDKLDKTHPVLLDYEVTIPPGGKTDALVETVIAWDFKGKIFKTRGLDADQTEAAIIATVKMLNLIENGNLKIIK